MLQYLLNIILLISSTSSQDLGILQNTEEITIREGTRISGLKFSTYEAFLGIPFAEPPIGNLRFKNPQPIKLWKGLKVADKFAFQCHQPGNSGSNSEDCLYLNIFRATGRSYNEPSSSVIVFIHGGGFQIGTSSPRQYGPEYLMAEGAEILVTIAYRLNVFGFLSTEDKECPGNFGLKDQVMALQWINYNIGAFGGDPGRVTLMGHEAGAVSVEYHLISPRSQGLFSSAFLLSGFIDAPWAQPRDHPMEFAKRHAKAMGIVNFENLTSSQLVHEFREFSAQHLVDGLEKMKTWNGLPLSYVPTVEPKHGKDSFISVDPRKVERQFFMKDVPIMVSIVPGDGINFVQSLIRSGSDLYNPFNWYMEQRMPQLLGMDASHPNMSEIVTRIRLIYFGESGEVAEESFDKLVQLSSEFFFHRPFYKTLQRMTKGMKLPIFGHIFDYRGSSSMSEVVTQSKRDYGVVHKDEMLYLFKGDHKLHIQLTKRDAEVQRYFIQHLLNFTKTGFPGYDSYDRENPYIGHFFYHKDHFVTRDLIPSNPQTFWADVEELYQGGSYFN